MRDVSFEIIKGTVVPVMTYMARHAQQGTPKKPHHSRKYWERMKFSHRGRAIPCFGGRV